MNSEHYSRVIKEWCAATGMQAWVEHDDMHVEIDNTLIGLIAGGPGVSGILCKRVFL